MTEYKYIFKKNLKEYEAQGWVYVKDIDEFIVGYRMKEYIELEECLIRKEHKQ